MGKDNVGIKTSLSALALSAFIGCAGPATPLGGLRITNPEDLEQGGISRLTSLFEQVTAEKNQNAFMKDKGTDKNKDGSSTRIEFSPSRQVFHKATPFKIRIEDPVGVKSNYRVVIRYNGLDITKSFLSQSKIEVGEKYIEITNPLLRLRPDKKHDIDVAYSPDNNLNYYWRSQYNRFEEPHCLLGENKTITNTDLFKPEKEVINLIEHYSAKSNINPSLTAALIAQESSFEADKISWAKAMGLTQITPVAEKEIMEKISSSVPHWPRYSNVENTSVLWLKTLVNIGRLNSGNEWKLNEETSIQGGIAYLNYLTNRWGSEENQKRIQNTFKKTPQALTQLVLASYHSGFTRVWNALETDGAQWLDNKKLKQARLYVNQVMSYCDGFSQETRQLAQQGANL